MRNLVFMHLESLNYANYKLNQYMFPVLSKWEKRSLSFSHYFSTATSTLMVISDLVYGGMLQYEVCDRLDYLPEQYCYAASLFDQLGSQGYITKILYYPLGGDCESAQKRHIVGFQSELVSFMEYEHYMFEAKRVIHGKQPFALMLCNTISNLALNPYIPNGEIESGLDWWRQGYQFLDWCVGEIMDLLEKEGMLENTSIIFYGDHGDDYYSHGNHNGLTHAIEPYASLIHTPFWIYDNRLDIKEIVHDLVSTIDIKEIAENLINLSEIPISCSDLSIPKRKYAISRNVYAAQPVRWNSFNKGYSITDGRFLFLVSNNGMELYDIDMDIDCQNNLLKFFVFEEGILHLKKELNNSLGYHYRFLMNMGSVRQIRQVFYYYREKIYEEILRLFCYAKCEDRIKELDFEKIHEI